jgi:ferredoxin-type protein NapH
MTPRTIKVARTVSQVVFFLLLVVFVTGTFCSFRLGGAAYLTCPLGTLQFTLSAQQILGTTILSGLFLLVVTLLLGRVFCGWVCPFGALLDWLQKPLARFRVNKERNSALLGGPESRYLKYGVLGGVVLAAGLFRSPAFCAICPVGTTCRTAGLQGINLGVETAVLPMFAGLEIVRKRFWCKTFCPIGALLALFARFSILKIRLPWDQCAGCRRCEEACAMDNSPHAMHERLKTDPEVLKALMAVGIPDLLDRPVNPDSFPGQVQEVLAKKRKKYAVSAAECTRCCSCLAACPVLNRQLAAPTTVGTQHTQIPAQ